MLVLNTNEQGSSGQVLSNSMIRAYPDFKSILLYPNINGGIKYGFSTTTVTTDDIIDFTTGDTSFSVNGTSVNVGSQTLNENLLLVGGLTGGNIGTDNFLYGTTNAIYYQSSVPMGKVSKIIRLGICETLEGGEIIGKKIITSFGRVFGFYRWSQLYSMNSLSFKIGIVYRLGLLHLDGSISYGDWIENPDYLSPEMQNVSSADGNRYCGASNRVVEDTTNGLTAVAGDRIIFEVGPRFYWSGLTANISPNTDRYISFGTKGTPGDITVDYNSSWTSTDVWNNYIKSGMRGRPIQISIE